MADRKKQPTFGALLIQGAREAVAHKRGELVAETTRAKATTRDVAVAPPPEYDKVRIQALRARLRVSQTVFAELLGASVSSVRAWERGERSPQPSTRRLLELAERSPEVFEENLEPVQ
jgi:putative transcriptional regulator